MEYTARTLTNINGTVIPTRKFASQLNKPEKLIAAGLGPCLNSSPPRNKGIGPSEKDQILQQVLI